MIVLEDIRLVQGEFELRDIGMRIPEGKYAVLMGETGSGKTSILEIICGLRRPDAGRVLLHGEDVTAMRPAARDVGYVPQDGALFKTMTVFEQMAFPLVIRREKSEEIERRIEELAGMLHLDHLLDRGPRDLSGGERQRVALGRALSFRPHILLFDEPVSALDEATRDQTVHLLKDVQGRTGATTLHVTHNSAEARELGDVLLRIENGQVVEAGMSK